MARTFGHIEQNALPEPSSRSQHILRGDVHRPLQQPQIVGTKLLLHWREGADHDDIEEVRMVYRRGWSAKPQPGFLRRRQSTGPAVSSRYNIRGTCISNRDHVAVQGFAPADRDALMFRLFTRQVSTLLSQCTQSLASPVFGHAQLCP